MYTLKSCHVTEAKAVNTRALGLVLLLLFTPWSGAAATDITARSEAMEPTPPVCNKFYPGAEAGLLHCNASTQAGLMLFAESSSDTLYLIDERGETRKMWISSHANGSGFGMDIGPNGELLRMLNDIPASEPLPRMDAGGGASHIEILHPDGSVFWEIEEYSDTVRLHHDAVFLPNGNVLAIAWEFIDESTARSLGRSPERLTSEGLWPDMIIEYERNKDGEAEVVWTWSAKDHLIQNEDIAKANFGDPLQHPHKLDVNAVGPHIQIDNPDWMHCNSIDYDPVHQHILLSCRNTEELYIVNHNITWEEASGPKGDLLYRWGNPANYGAGEVGDQRTVVQHDAQFIPAGRPYAGSISYFSNEMVGSSKVGIITPPRNGSSFTFNLTAESFDPQTPNLEFTLPNGWGPRFQSGATLLPNGQFLISHALRGKLGQIGADSVIDWEYNLPFNPGNEPAPRTERMVNPIFFKATFFEHNDVRMQFVGLERLGVIEQVDDLCLDDGDDILWDANGDGCIEDDDMDGINNQFDWCPNTAEGTQVLDDGCPVPAPKTGCTDPEALNYDAQAEMDDGSCAYPPPVEGCMDENAINHDPHADVHVEAMCEYPPPPVEGCTNSTALNHNADATVDDGSCEYPPPPIVGCFDLNASNHNPNVTQNDPSLCLYPEVEEPEPEVNLTIPGCMDVEALNHDINATQSDGSCVYPEPQTNTTTNETLQQGEGSGCPAVVDCENDGTVQTSAPTPHTFSSTQKAMLSVFSGTALGAAGLAFWVSRREGRRMQEDEYEDRHARS